MMTKQAQLEVKWLKPNKNTLSTFKFSWFAVFAKPKSFRECLSKKKICRTQ